MPKVSIILTSYNHGTSIAKTIEGVLSQTYQDFELIIWDDASSDNSWEVITSFKDPRIKSFRNSENLNGVYGINRAISEVSEGDYIAIHHSGDNWHPEKISRQIEVLDNDISIGAVFTGVQVVDSDGHKIKDKSHFYATIFEQPNRKKHEWLRFFLTKGNALCHPSVMIRKSCFKQCGLYKTGLVQTADFDMWIRICLKYDIFIIQDKLTYFTIEADNKNSSSHSVVTEARSTYECYRLLSDSMHELKNSDWQKVFPECEIKHNNQILDDFYFAKTLIDVEVIPSLRLIAIDMLYSVIQDEEKFQIIRDRHNFGHREFISLIYSLDPFNVCRFYDVKKELNSVLFENSRLIQEKNSLEKSYTTSISWRLTRPIRAFRRLLTNPRYYYSFVKNHLTKTPFWPLFRRIYASFNDAKSCVSNLGISRKNLIHLNTMSEKRASVLFSKWHVDRKLSDFSKSDLPEIDISIVTYNNGRWLDKFTKSLIEQNYPLKKINLYFVDNTSTDNTYEKLLNFSKKNKHIFSKIIIYSQPNLGFGSGHDYAIRKFKNKFFLVTNIDLEFEKDSITNVVKSALNDVDDVACWEIRQKPYEHPKYYDPVTFETSWCSHACVLIRREAYNVVGGYEPRLFMYGEDVELSYRFRSKGYILRYVPSASVKHYTYDDVNQIKPIQFSGSTLANFLIRLRYGDTKDRAVGLLLQLALIVRGAGFKGSRKLAFHNLKSILKKAKHFKPASAVENSFFPFRYFDYEMTRDGAFYKLIDSSAISENLPLVTIVTRTYQGRQKLLEECMASVINQTYPNIQHIIVEDGGRTCSYLIKKAKKFYRDAYNVEFLGLEKRGRSYAGNKGLELAEGEYCIFLDDDDLIFPDHVEVLINELLADNSLDAVYSLAWDVHTEINRDTYEYKEHNYETLPVFYQEFSYDVLLSHNYIPIQSIMFRRELYKKRGGFNQDMDQLEDWNLWTRFAYKSKFKFISKTTSIFRTPNDKLERLSRVKLLDEAFSSAVRLQKDIHNIVL